MHATTAELLAGAVALLHAAVLAIYVAGALCVLRGGFSSGRLKLWQWGYLAVVAAMSMTVVGASSCPLTLLEKAIRVRGDLATRYDGSYIENYLPFLPSMLDQLGSVVLLLLGCVGAGRALIGWVRCTQPDTLVLSE